MEDKGISDSEKGQLSPEPHHELATIFLVKSSHLAGLRSAAEFVLIMGYIYICDRTYLIEKGPKQIMKAGALRPVHFPSPAPIFKKKLTLHPPRKILLARGQVEEGQG